MKTTNLIILTFIFLLSGIVSNAKELKLESVGFPSYMDLTASIKPRLDNNGRKCALLKIQFPHEGLKFEGSIIGDIDYDGTEYLVYVPEHTRYINVKYSGSRSLMIDFSEYEVNPIEGNRTYLVVISCPDDASVPKPDAAELKTLAAAKKAYKDADEGDGSFENAFRLFKSIEKNPEAMFYLGRMYASGLGVVGNDEKALSYFQRSARLGYSDSQLMIGRCLIDGSFGSDIDEVAAVEWFRKAAEQGNAGAMYELGNCYEWGIGVTQDQGQADAWYRKAAENGFDPEKVEWIRG